jgi:hypothetical protein
VSTVRTHRRSVISEAVAPWTDIARLLRGGEADTLIPVIIPRHRRRVWWMLPLWLGVYALLMGVTLSLAGADAESAAGDLAYGTLAGLSYAGGAVLVLIGVLWWWRSSIVEIEQGTNGVLTRYGAVVRTLDAGRHYLWHPWSRVDFVVDTATEIPYSAPVMACPTQENVPLRSIEFFLKFRITDAVLFVRTIGAGNFDLVLSSAVQDAIRQRARKMRTERAYDLHAGAAQPPALRLRRAYHRLQHPGRAAADAVPAAPGHPGAGRQGAHGLRAGVGPGPQAPDRPARHGHRAGQEGARRPDRRGQGRAEPGP